VCVRVDLRGRSLAASAAGVTVATASQRCLPRLVSNVTGYLTPDICCPPPPPENHHRGTSDSSVCDLESLSYCLGLRLGLLGLGLVLGVRARLLRTELVSV